MDRLIETIEDAQLKLADMDNRIWRIKDPFDRNKMRTRVAEIRTRLTRWKSFENVLRHIELTNPRDFSKKDNARNTIEFQKTWINDKYLKLEQEMIFLELDSD